MSVESNIAAALRIYSEIWNEGKLQVVDELYALNFVDHDPAAAGLPSGQEGARAVFFTFLQAFPDIQFSVTLTVAQDDKVVVRYLAEGTHTGPLMNIPPTGKHARISGIEVLHFEDGVITERWGNFDMLGLLQKLGIVPAPGA